MAATDQTIKRKLKPIKNNIIMKDKKPLPYVFLTLKEIIKTFNHDVSDDYKEVVRHMNYRKILLNQNDCDEYLGTPNKNKPFIHKRYSLQDFYYDFLTHIGPMETKLFKENKLEDNHYLFNSIMGKLKVPALSEQFNGIVSLIYAQGDIHPHWNRVSLLKKETIDEIIFKECLHGGINAFNKLSKVFSPEQFLNAINTENKNYNLSECLILKASTHTLKNAQPLIDTVSCLSLLGQKVDYKKIKEDILLNYADINYFVLHSLNDPKINSFLLNSKAKKQYNGGTYKLLDSARDTYLVEQWNRCVAGKSVTDLNGNTYTNLPDFKVYLVINNLWNNIEEKVVNNIHNQFQQLLKNNDKSNSTIIIKDFTKKISFYELDFVNPKLLNKMIVYDYKTEGYNYSFVELVKHHIVVQSLFDMFKGRDVQINLPFKNLDEGKIYITNINKLDNICALMVAHADTLDNDHKKAWRFLAMQLKIDNKNDVTVKKLKI